jgi:hypothetical protein
MVYDINTMISCQTPDFNGNVHDQKAFFIYSIPAAYLLSPLSLLPYLQAKAILLTLELLSYAASIPLLVNSKKLNPLPFQSRYFLLACLWPPLLTDIIYGQINALLLLLITLSITIGRQKSYLTGVILGIASLFKLFPIGIALLLSLKNKRIAWFALLVLILGAWISGWEEWFTAITNMPKIGATPIYRLINTQKIYWYIGYIFVISTITILTALSTSLDDFFITALAITFLFIAIPIVEYYHLVILILPIIYLILNNGHNHWFIKAMIAASVSLVSFCKLFDINTQQNMMYIACFLLWGVLQINSYRRLNHHFHIK